MTIVGPTTRYKLVNNTVSTENGGCKAEERGDAPSEAAADTFPWPTIEPCPIIGSSLPGGGEPFVDTEPAREAFYVLTARQVLTTKSQAPTNDEIERELRAFRQDKERAADIVEFLVEATILGGESEREVIRKLHDAVFNNGMRLAVVLDAVTKAIAGFDQKYDESLSMRVAEVYKRGLDGGYLQPLLNELGIPMTREPTLAELDVTEAISEMTEAGPYSKWPVFKARAVAHLLLRLRGADRRFAALKPEFAYAQIARAAEGSVKAATVAAELAVEVNAFDYAKGKPRKKAVSDAAQCFRNRATPRRLRRRPSM